MQTLSCDLWLMERNALRQFTAMAGRLICPQTEEVREMARAAAAATPRREKKLAIIPVHGVLEARPSFVGEMLGMTSYERVGYQLDLALADESVSTIVMDFATPGGMVYGCPEVAQKIYEARGRKPVIGVANPMAASGGFWMISACERVVVTPSGDVGSVGVIAEHVDISQAMERQGEKVTTIRSSASPFKGENSDAAPLTDEARSNMQARADKIYGQFSGDLARFRGISVDQVNKQFGQGRVVDSRSALAVGMVDRIDTLQGTVEKLLAGRIRLGGNSAQDNWDAPTPRERRLERVAAINSTIGDEHGAA